jgi:prophage maintenance system killer protein
METLSARDIQGIIDYNRDELAFRNGELDIDRDHEFNKNILDRIVCKVNNLKDIVDKRLRIIKKATIIFCEIAHYQPFLEGNKAAALYAGEVFLRRHDFEIPLNSESDKEEMMKLLTVAKEKMVEGIEDKLCQEIEKFLIDKVVIVF